MTNQIEVLRDDNLSIFVDLLKLRGEAPADYFYWKYCSKRELNMPRGFLAKQNGSWVGCIGIVPRVWHSADGKEVATTWAADLYVNPTARGSGIGSQLFETVKGLASSSLFIPGTEGVRSITKRIGYKPLLHILETELIVNPLRYGWLKGGGRLERRIFRSLKTLLSVPAQSPPKSNLAKNFDLILSFPEPRDWSLESERHLFGIPHLQRTREFLDWLERMPSNSPKNRKLWWHLKSRGLGVLGCIEEDRWGARRSRIFDYWGEGLIGEKKSLGDAIANSMRQLGVDYIQACGYPGVFEFSGSSLKTPTPVFSAGEMSQTLIQGVDRESWYRDLWFSRSEV